MAVNELRKLTELNRGGARAFLQDYEAHKSRMAQEAKKRYLETSCWGAEVDGYVAEERMCCWISITAVG